MSDKNVARVLEPGEFPCISRIIAVRASGEFPGTRIPGYIFILFFLLFFLNVKASEPSALPGSFSGRIEMDSTVNTTRLPHRYIDPATLEIISPEGDTLRLEQDFELDPTLGILTWKTPPPQWIQVSFRFLPVTVADTLVHHTQQDARRADTLLTGESVDLLTDLRRKREDAVFGRSDLMRSGHIMRGVQVGSGRDLSLESGLRLALDGRIARDIEVSALLDDRNLPIQPEGTSRRLEEIDQVYVDIRAQRMRGRFGDYTLDFDGGRYGTFNRRLEGGQAEYRHPDLKVKAAGAVTRAQFHSNSFRGIDRIQGPYELRGRNGEHPILIEGGTEKVWVDGIQRIRGENEDYIIDYSRGEITFTTSLPITSESRIEVDFEYSPEVFPRNLYAGQMKAANPSQSFQITANYIEEGDDYERPIGFEMTPDTRSFLSGSGDGPEAAKIPTEDSLGLGKGDYTRIDTTLTDNRTFTIFKFVQPDEEGRPKGSWNVLFSFIHKDSGDYKRKYDSAIAGYIFEWVSPEDTVRGYAPVRLVPLPERRRQGAVSMQVSPAKWLQVSSDLAASGQDFNTLSPVGDSDNTGFAQNSSLTLSLPTKRKISPLEATVRARDEDEHFRPFARSREVEYQRRWGLDSLGEGVYERERGVSLTGRPLKGVTLKTGYNTLDRGGFFSSVRFDRRAEINAGKLNFNAGFENIESRDDSLQRKSDWLRSQGMAHYRLGIWVPGIDGEWENREETTSDTLSKHQYLRWRASWALSEWRGHQGVASYERRNRDGQLTLDEYGRLYDEDAASVKWTYYPFTLPWRSEVEIHHREKRFTVADSANVTSDLASLRTSCTPYNGALAVDLQYRLNQTVTRPSAQIAYQVPRGEGDYIRVGDEYFYDPEIGNYILRSEPTGDALPTTDFAGALDVDWSPHRLPDDKGKIDGFGWEDISLVTSLAASEATRWDRPSDIYLLKLNRFQTDSTLNGRLAWRQDIHLFRSSRDFSARARYDTEKRLVSLYQSGAERYGNDSWELRLRKALTEQTDIEGEGRYVRQLKSLARRSSADRFRLRRGRLTFSYRPSRFWILTAETRVLRDSQLADSSPVLGAGVKPGITYALRDKGRINLDFEALWVETEMERVPFELADGRPKGRNGRSNLSADIQLSSHLTGRATYTIRLDQGREPVHLARMEVSAFF